MTEPLPKDNHSVKATHFCKATFVFSFKVVLGKGFCCSLLSNLSQICLIVMVGHYFNDFDSLVPTLVTLSTFSRRAGFAASRAEHADRDVPSQDTGLGGHRQHLGRSAVPVR